VSVPGSHSNVISSASNQGDTAVNRSTSDLSCFVDRNDGVPPPKYTKSSFRPAIAAIGAYNSHSRARRSRYDSTSRAFRSV
jgi:hypothetical protein